jgi:hypothetical protein
VPVHGGTAERYAERNAYVVTSKVVAPTRHPAPPEFADSKRKGYHRFIAFSGLHLRRISGPASAGDGLRFAVDEIEVWKVSVRSPLVIAALDVP